MKELLMIFGWVLPTIAISQVKDSLQKHSNSIAQQIQTPASKNNNAFQNIQQPASYKPEIFNLGVY
jgi:hypothetical protein